MMNVPSFGQLKRHFPYKPAYLTPGRRGGVPSGTLVATNKDLVTSIGGGLLSSLSAIYKDLDQMNTCAVRLSYCLNKCGSKVTGGGGARIYRGADGDLYIISADEMIAYMRSKYGKPALIFDGRGKDDTVLTGKVTFPTQGIIGYDWEGRIEVFGATGHVDIGKMPSAKVADVTEIGTGSYYIDGAMKVFLWAAAP